MMLTIFNGPVMRWSTVPFGIFSRIGKGWMNPPASLRSSLKKRVETYIGALGLGFEKIRLIG
jgi:hypothetical protein